MGEQEANRELLEALQIHHKSIRDHQKLCCVVTGLMIFFASGVVASALNIASSWDFERLVEAARCKCNPMRVEANNSGISIIQRHDPAEQLAREILQNQGDIKK